MTAATLLSELKQQGVYFSVIRDGLTVKARKGVLTEKLKSVLKEYKPELLRILRTSCAGCERHEVDVDLGRAGCIEWCRHDEPDGPRYKNLALMDRCPGVH